MNIRNSDQYYRLRFLIFFFFLLYPLNIVSEECIKHMGAIYCTNNNTKLNNSFLKYISKKDHKSKENIRKKWNDTIKNVVNYLEKYDIPLEMVAEGKIREGIPFIEIRNSSKGLKFKSINDLLDKNYIGTKNEVIKNKEFYIKSFETLIKAKKLSSHIKDMYLSGKRSTFRPLNKKTHVDEFGNIFLEKSILKSDFDEKLVLLHEAFHLFPITYDKNIILRKYIDINMKESFPDSNDSRSEITDSANKNLFVGIDYEIFFEENSFVDLYDKESLIDFFTINYLKRNGYDCNKYIDLLSRLKIKKSRLKFSETYCETITEYKNIDLGLVEVYFDVISTSTKSDILLNRNKYQTVESINLLIDKHEQEAISLENVLAINLVRELYGSNITLIKNKMFRKEFNNYYE